MGAPAQLKEWSWTPVARADWCAFVPENGAGLLVNATSLGLHEGQP